MKMPTDIPDPWHSDYETYRNCIYLISNSMEELFESIDQLDKK